MPTLTLKFNEKVLGVYTFDKEKTIIIGRHKGNDIVIENLGASGHHAKIEYQEGAFIFTDLDSTNGSFVNAKHISTHPLNTGDVITIAKHSLVFKSDKADAESNETESLMDKTMVIDTEQHRAMLAQSEAGQSGESPDTKEKAAILIFLTGNDGEMALTRKLTKIGKGSDADVAIKGWLVANTAATISARPNGYFLSYVGGISKPKVNGSTVKETVKLNKHDVIRIGSMKAEFNFRE